MKTTLLLFSFFISHFLFSQTNWIQKTDFGGTGRWSAIGASIGTKGYIGLGRDNNGRKNDLWEWNQTTNSWIQKANFPESGREGAIGFSIGNKLYVGTGYDGNVYQGDFWEYDPTINVWTQKSSIPIERAEGVGFSIGTKGYIMTGSTSNSPGGTNDLWEYDQTTDVWTQKANIPAPATFTASGFSIGTKGYLLVNQSNFWEYDPSSNTWSQKANIGVSTNIGRATDFSANGKGYLGGIGQNKNEIWEYSPINNIWKHLENIPNGERGIATGFSIGNLLYVGTGYASQFKKDFWETDQANICAYPEITYQPITQNVNIFNNAVLTVIGTGSSLSYQWQLNSVSGYQNISNSGQFSGTETNNLTVSNVLTNNANQIFRCVLSSGYCSLNSNTTSIDVNCIPFISTQPNNQSETVGNNVSFFIQSPYTNDLTFQWQSNIGTGFQNLSNAGQYTGTNNDTLILSNITQSNNNQLFRCLVSSGTCTDTSNIVSLNTVVNSVHDLTNKSDICSIFPNPSKDLINIHINSCLCGSNYSIVDVLGKEIIKGKLISETTIMNLSEIPKGIYFLHLKKNNVIFKILKD